LYHGTNSSLLADILEQGLRPNRETGAKNWTGTEFRHNVNAVYLASDRDRAEYYARHSAAEQHAKGRLDATPVVLRVTVPTDKLLADDDWLRREFGGDIEKGKANVSNWHDSLTKFGQVAFLGIVPPSAVEVVEGAPSEPREHEFAGLAAGTEGLSDTLAAALDSCPSDTALAVELSDAVVKWFKEDYYWVDELDAVDPSDPSTLLAAAEVVGSYAWEPDEDHARDNASSTIYDIEWSNEHEGTDDPVPDEEELIGEMMEEEAEKDRKDRASLASRLQEILDRHQARVADNTSGIGSTLVRELASGGWGEAQLRSDALKVWVCDNEVFFSLGDWAKVPSSDVEAAVKRAFGDGVLVNWDFEAGPSGDDWEQVI